MDALASDKNLKAQTAAQRCQRMRALKRKRGTGVIYDVIDEWLASAFARWIARNQMGSEPESEKL